MLGHRSPDNTDYKQRKIEVTPQRQADGTWKCSYRIIEFHATCWRFCTGALEGCFASREMAVAAAVTEAKRIVDRYTRASKSDTGSVLGTYGKTIRRLFAWARGWYRGPAFP
ncbi:MAG: hypothetical protein OJF50_000716 [Nitrospira sp.]|jgi:hypothetical protein|nr:hypothetical protein [Nitrospira sp.]